MFALINPLLLRMISLASFLPERFLCPFLSCSGCSCSGVFCALGFVKLSVSFAQTTACPDGWRAEAAAWLAAVVCARADQLAVLLPLPLLLPNRKSLRGVLITVQSFDHCAKF